jgi:hypothetical protein
MAAWFDATPHERSLASHETDEMSMRGTHGKAQDRGAGSLGGRRQGELVGVAAACGITQATAADAVQPWPLQVVVRAGFQLSNSFAGAISNCAAVRVNKLLIGLVRVALAVDASS